jgi:type IV pilus assembly protein PilY1
VAFNNGENPATGPWDLYRCFRNKSGTSNDIPSPFPTGGISAAETALGFSNYIGSYYFSPTDSDFAQGILDFGRHTTWSWVGPTWFTNSSPGRGFLNVPIAPLTAAQGSTLKAQLACNVPGDPSPCTASGIRNAGLTPIQGTLLTAKDYFAGSWNTAAEGYTTACYPLPTSCGKDFVVLLTDGLPSTDRNGATISDPVAALAAAAAAAATLKAAGVETYVIGFALPYGTDPASLNSIAAAGGTGAAFSATDEESLQAAFKNIFDDIFQKTSAFGSISQNSTAINTGSRIYQGRFDSTNWSGELLALGVPATGPLVPIWSTDDAGRFATPAARKVFTLKPGTGGVEFKLLADLTSTQKDALRSVNCSTTLTGDSCGQARIDWLRGDKSKDDKNGGPLRRREKVLGDVISSSPYFVADTNTLYVGANDGMLHAFDAATGNELFAYLPNSVLPRVHKLTQPAYLHEYFVDGEIAVSTRADTPGRNILVGALGRGGKALYALDVSAPASFGASKVLWEFTDADMGLSLAKPFITKLNNGVMAVIVGNGHNSTSERAVLFVINLETGALIRKIDTQSGSASANNGMSSPRGWDRDGNCTVDTVYAGDRQGNLWKFDFSSASSTAWASSFTSAAVPAPLFVARDAANKRQPITGGISLGMNNRTGDANFGKLFVFFGSGQYLLGTDVSDKSVQSWYGLVDGGTAIADRSELRQRSITTETTTGGYKARAFSAATAGDMSGKKGWYLDWTSSAGAATGERITTDSKYFGNVLLATSIIPSTDICTPGGDGYLNAIDPFSGASLTSPFFDSNGDGLFTDADLITASGSPRAVGSIQPGNNLPSEGILIGNRLIASGTSGDVKSIGARNPARSGRIAWREIIRRP